MKVNFNNARIQALHAYDDLVEKLNRSILKDTQYALPNDIAHGQEIDIKGYVLVDAEDIKERLDDLRRLLGTIAMTFEEGNEEFKDVFEEIYPEPKSMATFNEEDDED